MKDTFDKLECSVQIGSWCLFWPSVCHHSLQITTTFAFYVSSGLRPYSRLYIGTTTGERTLDFFRRLTATAYFLPQLLRGNVGLFFTNQPRGDVISWFQTYSEQDHARAGFLATDDVVIQEGPLKQFPHSMEPHLRILGLPTFLHKGR